MTPDQLRAASHGEVPASGQDPGHDMMTTEYSMGKFKFNVVFDYAPRSDDPGNNDPSNLVLSAVLLNLDLSSGNCVDLSVKIEAQRVWSDGVDGPCFRRLSAIGWPSQEKPLGQEPSTMQTNTIGLDLTKNVFQVHGIDSAGQTTLRNKLRRSELIG
jgi:hypothetical protein